MSIDTVFYLFGLAAYVLVQIRPLVPADKVAKLPKPLITLIERAAGNWGSAQNQVKPEQLK